MTLWLEPLQKNDQSAEQTAKEWACLECTERSTDLLAESRESVISIMHSMSILVALKTPSLMANSSHCIAILLSKVNTFSLSEMGINKFYSLVIPKVVVSSLILASWSHYVLG